MPRLQLDLAAPAVPLRPVWTFGANTCHAPLWLRDDLISQVATMHRELGFRYIRAHGVLCDKLIDVLPGNTFNVERIGPAFDRLLATGVKPFVELSHLPSSMSREPVNITAYKFWCGPPKDWKQWAALVTAVVRFLTDRYGRDELRTWYFEVWNEPDINFWKGTKQDYFKLYDLAVAAVKAIDGQYRVGGPATSKTAWVKDFVEHVTRPSADCGGQNPPCDFVSTHAYPSDLAFVDSDRGAVTLQNSNIMRQLFSEARAHVDAGLGREMPLICGEWNSSAGPLAWNHDECNNAAYVVKTMAELEPMVEGSLFWNASDIYEECHFHYEPFHGGYGLMTVNDVPKAAYHAFRLLKEHTGLRVPAKLEGVPDGVGALASRAGRTLRVLTYHHIEPGVKSGAVPLQLSGLPEGAGELRVERVLPGAGSAYETWLELGRPAYVNAAILDSLTQASRPRVETLPADAAVDLPPGTIAAITCTLPGPGFTDGAGV